MCCPRDRTHKACVRSGVKHREFVKRGLGCWLELVPLPLATELNDVLAHLSGVVLQVGGPGRVVGCLDHRSVSDVRHGIDDNVASAR